MEPIIAIAVLVGVVWGAVFFLRGGLLAGALIVLLAGTCFGHHLFHFSEGPIPLTSDRILWAVLMVQLFFWWRMGLTEPIRIGWTEVLLLAFIGVLAASIVTHDWELNRFLPVSQFVFYYVMPLGIYWVGRQARLTERGIRTMYVLLGVFGIYVALTAIAESQGLTALMFPRYISSSQYQEFVGRSRGPLLNPAANGLLLGSCLGAGLMMWPSKHRWGQLLLIIYSTLLCFGIFCTLTRSAWMGGSLGLLLLVLLVLPRLYRPWILAAALICSAALVAFQLENIVEFKRDRDLTAQQTAESVQLRPILAVIAWEMFCDRPIFGCGFGHYTDQHVYYLTNRNMDMPLEQGRTYEQHNVWLSLLTETGLVGMMLFTLLMIAWLQSAWRLWRADNAPLWMRQQGLLFLVVAANYFMNGMFHNLTIIPMVNMILFFMAGLTMNLQAQAVKWKDDTGELVASEERE